jgi:DNA ligase 1
MTFHDLAEYFSHIEKISSRLEITSILSDLFHKASNSEIECICYLLQGRIAPLFIPLEFGMADKLIIRVLMDLHFSEVEKITSLYKKTGDLGIVAMELGKNFHPIKEVSVHHVFDEFHAIVQMKGIGSQDKKIFRMKKLFLSLDPLSRRYAIRIPLGKLRLGLSDMTILDGLSWMIKKDKSLRNELEDAYNVQPDIGVLAREFKENGLVGIKKIGAKIGVPILPCLCQRIPTADEMIKKMGTVFVEPKYDGTRVQIHFSRTQSSTHSTSLTIAGESKSRAQSFSRNLENTTYMFPELFAMDKQILADNVILDSEAVGIDPDTGNIVPFQMTITRKRKYGIDQLFGSIPLRFYVFDILYKDNSILLNLPLSKRKEILEKTVQPGQSIALSPYNKTDNPDTIRKLHHQYRKEGLEGVIVKKFDGLYRPGRRDFTWVKLKEEEGHTGKLSDTIDAVVMGYYRGEGKRTKFGIGAFLVGILKNDSIVTLSKIGTGVTDDQWKELKILFDEHKSKEKPMIYGDVDKSLIPDIWIDPSVVVEIAGDDITISPLHGVGFAIRFPRLINIRKDKNVTQITTMEEMSAIK